MEDTAATPEETPLFESNKRANLPIDVVVVVGIMVLGAVYYVLQPTQVKIVRL